MLCTCASRYASIVILKQLYRKEQKIEASFDMLQCQISFLFHLLIKELQELHSALEEAKADIVGLWALKFLIDKVSIAFFFLNAFESYVSVNYVTIHGIYISVA